MSKNIKLISIADNPETLAHGLKFVSHIAANTGMLFDFKHPRVLSFWMQDCCLPLEIAFIDHHNMIVKTERMIPLSLRSVTSGRPCVMALEVPAGTFDNDTVGKSISLDLENNQVTIND